MKVTAGPTNLIRDEFAGTALPNTGSIIRHRLDDHGLLVAKCGKQVLIAIGEVTYGVKYADPG